MSRFTADCSLCCGLCCIVPAYLREQGFPFDKPAERPCRHLAPGGGCAIHAGRLEHGFGACSQFDCHGAGQWVIRQLFAGARWQDAPAQTRRAMATAYRQWLPRFEAAALLEAALPSVTAAQRPLLLARMNEVLDAGRPGRANAHLRRDTICWIRGLLACREAAPSTTGTAP